MEETDILNAIADGILVIDKEYKIVFANKAALDTCRLSEKEVVGSNCHALHHRCLAPPCNLPDRCPHKEVFSTGKPTRVKHVHLCPDGRERVYMITVSPVKDDKGNVVRLVEVLKDVTEEEAAVEALREKAEAECDEKGRPLSGIGTVQDITKNKMMLKSLQNSETLTQGILESVGEGFAVIDPDYRIISANRAYCEQIKSSPADIVGRYCYEVSHRFDRPCFQEGEECAPMHTFKTGAPHSSFHIHYDKDGAALYIETKSFPMKDESGNIYAVIETLRDITETRNLELQLRHTQKMEALGTLAGGIAHDTNNMLTVIIGYGFLMQRQMEADDPRMAHLTQILGAGEKVAQLTKKMLAFSRKQSLEVKIANLNDIISNFTKMLTMVTGENIELRLTPSEQDLIAKIDIGQIEQVLMNLATNARDAMPQGGDLTIGTTLLMLDAEFTKTHGFGKPGRYACITVSDTGCGMDEKTKKRIFEPFFTTKETGSGTGLGLAIIYGIVKQHNGYINCYSESGVGTTFRIYLPLVMEDAAEKAEAAEDALPKGGPETILLAEDEPTIRELQKNILVTAGYTVIEAVNGEDAVDRFRENKEKIQLLLFDIMMPKKNGKEAYDDIKNITPDIKVVFTSGYTGDILQRFGLEEGFDFIPKPISPNMLLRKVREVLDR